MSEENWKPKEGIELEKNAEMAVKNFENNLIITAGPGAGKTELLAQKAAFLLETNKCYFPKRILAISFKVDSAENLKKRVEKRIGKELARRFDSMTFDAFAVNLLNRFKNGIDEKYRPSEEYEINLRYYVNEKEALMYVDNNLTDADIYSISFNNFDFYYLFKGKQSTIEEERKQYLSRKI